ncbi:MAG: MFS transporter, partial [Betaproteobacteria bacterium]
MTTRNETRTNAPPTGQFSLLRQRRFAPFFWTQFCGAGNDNVFKISFTSLVTYQATRFSGIDSATAAFLISAIFILPFVLFSATSGQLADKYDKAKVMRLVKSLEIAIMLIGSLGFITYNASVLFAATFLMGLHSTLFGPVKYAYLPQHLQPEELTGGNGMVEMGTFVAILLGTILGGQLAGIGDEGPMWIAGFTIGIAIIGRFASSLIPAAPPSDPGLIINWNPFSETWKNLQLARTSRPVFLSLLGISWLWFFGATFLTSFFNFAKEVLGGDTNVVTMLLAVFSVGVGVGSLLCEKLSGHKVEIGLVPFGSIGMTLFAVDLYFASRGLHPAGVAGLDVFFSNHAHWRVLADLFLLSLFSGLYSVPLYALIQSRCEPTHRARIIAANNILNALFMIVSALLGVALLSSGFTIPQLFLVTAVLNAVVAIYIYSLVPEFLMRFLCWLLVHSIYRV